MLYIVLLLLTIVIVVAKLIIAGYKPSVNNIFAKEVTLWEELQTV